MHRSFVHIVKIFVLTGSLLCSVSFAGISQNASYLVKQLTKKDGLTSDVAYYLHQDRSGLIWISTERGLNRYDGHRIKVYQHIAGDSSSLRSNRISQITEGRDGLLWIATGNEILHSFNPVKEEMKAYILESGKYPGNSRLLAAIDDSIHQKVWIICRNIVACMDRMTGDIKYLLPSEQLGTQSENINDIFSFIHYDKEQKIYVTTNGGIFIINFASARLEWPADVIRKAINGRPIYSVLVEDEFLWLTLDDHALLKIHRMTGDYHRFKINISDKGYIRCMAELDHETLVLGSLVEGVWLFDKKTEKILPLNVLRSQEVSGYSTDTWSLLIDALKRIWVATADGLYIFQKPSIPVQHFQLDNERSSQSVSAEFYVEGLSYYSAEKLYLIGLRNGTIEILDQTGTEVWKTQLNVDQLHDILSWKGYHWIATDRGIRYMKDGAKKFDEFHPELLNQLDIIDLEAGNDGQLYGLSANDFSVVRIDSSDFGVKSYSFSLPNTSIVRAYSSKVKVSSDGNIWVNTLKRVIRYDPNFNETQYFDRYTSPFHRISSSRIRSLGIDHSDQLWIGYNSAGIEKLIYKAGGNYENRLYTESDGMLSNQVLEIESDSNDNLWITNSIGLSYYNRGNESFTGYTDRDGLIRENMDKFIMHSLKILPDGKVFLGEFNGFSILHRSQELKATEPDKITFTGISVFDEPKISFGVLRQSIPIRLQHDENFFTIYFTAPIFIGGQNQHYRYRLNQYDRSWRYCTNGESPYTNVPPGNYRFEVQAANTVGEWNGVESAIDIHVIPSFTQTLIFKIFLGLVLLGIFLGVYAWHIRNIKEKERLQSEFYKKLMEAETSALRAQMNPHFIFNALNSIKGYIANNDPKSANRHLTNFSKLMRLVLSNSRNPLISLEKELEALEVYIQLELLRFPMGFDCVINISADVHPRSILIPPMTIQPFVENAIWHGLLQKKSKGSLHVLVLWKMESLQIRIKDNGIGRIKAKELKSKSGSDKKSYGMDITRQRIENFCGDDIRRPIRIIDLKDEIGGALGTEVILSFPKHKIFSNEEKIASPDH